MSETLSWLGFLADGLRVTVALSLAIAPLSVALSAVIAIIRICPVRALRVTALLYVDLFRSIPLLALLFFIFYGLGAYVVRLGISPFWLAVITLTIVESAYLAEVFRGTIESIPKSQWEAAASLGLGWISTVRFIVVPQSLLPAVPSVVVLLVYVIKDSSLASLITVTEVTTSANILVSHTFRPFQVYMLLAAMYLAIIAPLTLLGSRLETAIRRPRKRDRVPQITAAH